MNNQTVRRGSVQHLRAGRLHVLECAALVAAGLVAFELATRYPCRHNTEAGSWRDKDWVVWFHAHQLYQRDPAELSESQLDAVQQWYRCLRLFDRYTKTGLDCLTDNECQQAVVTLENVTLENVTLENVTLENVTLENVTLEKLNPNVGGDRSLLSFYEACRQRLADADGQPPASGAGRKIVPSISTNR